MKAPKTMTKQCAKLQERCSPMMVFCDHGFLRCLGLQLTAFRDAFKAYNRQRGEGRVGASHAKQDRRRGNQSSRQGWLLRPDDAAGSAGTRSEAACSVLALQEQTRLGRCHGFRNACNRLLAWTGDATPSSALAGGSLPCLSSRPVCASRWSIAHARATPARASTSTITCENEAKLSLESHPAMPSTAQVVAGKRDR